MIVNLRGTNGSGKSYVVHRLLERCSLRVPVSIQDGRRTIGYVCDHRFFVAGHYDIANGGVDTLSSLDYAYHLVRHYSSEGFHAIFEGKNMSDGHHRVTALHHEGRDVRVVFLDTSLDECVRSVRSRGHRISERTIERLYVKSMRERVALERVSGLTVLHENRERVLEIVGEWVTR